MSYCSANENLLYAFFLHIHSFLVIWTWFERIALEKDIASLWVRHLDINMPGIIIGIDDDPV